MADNSSTAPTPTPPSSPPHEDDYSLEFFIIASVLVGVFTLIAYYAYQKYKQMMSPDPTTPKLLSEDESHEIELSDKNEEAIFHHTSPSSQPPYTPDQHMASPSDREYDPEYHTYHDDGAYDGGTAGEGGEGEEGMYDPNGDGGEGGTNYEEGHVTVDETLDTFDVLACDEIEGEGADALDESGFADVYTGVEEGDLVDDPVDDGVYLDMGGDDGDGMAGEMLESGDVGQEFDEIGLDGPDQAPESNLDESYALPDDVTGEHHFEMEGDTFYDEGDEVPLTAE